MRRILIITFSVILGVSAFALVFTYLQAQRERLALSADLQYRTRILAESLKESIEPAFAGGSTQRLKTLVDTFSDREFLVGLAVYDAEGARVAGAIGISEEMVKTSPVITQAIEKGEPVGDFVGPSADRYLFAVPLGVGSDRAGFFLVVQDASYITSNITDRWQGNLLGTLIYLFLFALAIAAIVRWVVVRPLVKLAESIRTVRSGGTVAESQHDFFFRPLAMEVGKLAQSLSQARRAASEEARMRLEKIDTPWTAERLREFVKAYIKDRPIYVVSHSEPFIHEHGNRGIVVKTPAGGVVTAVGSVMEACGGTWFAYGSGNADKETVDENDEIQVPPDEPRYTLRRVWLTEDDIQGYYRGFANEALWPLCHIAHVRPQFRKEDWTAYRKVNGQFAETVLAELKGVDRPIVLIQDYHFALLPRMIKEARPDAHVAVFWHIPWPSAESFSICPWRKEILEGMLGADIIGFHTQQFCNNFMDTVGKEVESLIDLDQFAVTREEHVSHVKPFPISIALTGNGDRPQKDAKPDRRFLEEFGVYGKLVLGVDRLDYTKGILERFRGMERLLDTHPKYRGKVTLLQISSPTRGGVEKYHEYAESVREEAERINRKFGQNGWRPIRFEYRHFSHRELEPLYKAADVCLVTSVHDGMNLVAKEYVAARDDEMGTLVLSQFTGAARDLKSALIVNPYSAEDLADAIHRGLTMSPTEQHRRMKAMRDSVKDYNVYRWAAEIIRTAMIVR